MSSIKVIDLCPTGAELFHDSESFLNELSDDEMSIVGAGRFGKFQSLVNVVINITSNTVFTVNGNTVNGNTFGNGVTVRG